MSLRAEIARVAASLHGWGVTSAAPFPSVADEMQRRIDEGSHAGLRFTYTDPVIATDVRRSYPWAARLVVGAHAYLPDAGSPGQATPGTGRVARFATADHYAPLREVLGEIRELLRAAGHRAEVLVDDNRLVDRAAGVRAGVGWWGRNTLVLAPGAGPWLLLGSVVTDAPIDEDQPMRRDCGTCHACLPACPTGALDDGVLDARLCLATWLQAPGVFPRALRRACGDRVYGCDDCLDACPPGVRARDATARVDGRVSLEEVLSLDDASLLERFVHFYVPQRRARYLRRNALIALGNSGGPGAVLLAAGYLGHPDWLLRAHAAWALGELGGAKGMAALEARRRRERNEVVGEEIEAALGALAGSVE